MGNTAIYFVLVVVGRIGINKECTVAILLSARISLSLSCIVAIAARISGFHSFQVWSPYESVRTPLSTAWWVNGPVTGYGGLESSLKVLEGMVASITGFL